MLLCASAGGLILAACSSGDDDEASDGTDGTSAAPPAATTAPAETSADGGEIESITVGAFDVIPRGFDPAFAGLPRSFVLLPVMEPLVAADVTTGEIVPGLAESFEQVDETTYTFDLRDGVEFSDGTPLTVEDVVYSITLHLDPAEESVLGGDLALVESVEATDASQITITLSEPDILLLTALSTTPIVKQSVRESYGDRRGTPDALPIGTGPYVVTEYTPEVRVVLERNDNYWGVPAAIQTMTVQTITDENTALSAFRAGELDAVFDVPPQRTDEYEEAGSVVTASDPEFTMVFLNPNIPPFDDVHVRRAILHAIDKEGIANSVYAGLAETHPAIVSKDLLATVMPEAEAEDLLAELEIPYDMDAAREELAQSSVPDGFDVSAIVNNAEPELRQFTLAMQDSLGELGINLTFEELPHNEYSAQIFIQDPHIVPFGIEAYGFNGYSPYEQLLGLSTPGFANVSDYFGPGIDELTADLRALSPDDDAAIAAAITELLRKVREDAVYGTVVAGESITALADGWSYDGYGPAFPLGAWFRQLSYTP